VARKHNPTADTLEELQSLGDRLARWMAGNPALILGTALGILVIAGGYGTVSSLRARSLDKASAALAHVEAGYREAMGAAPDAIEIAEPANPETARAARAEYLARYREVAETHQGEAVGALAWIQVGNLEASLGDREKAIQTWSSAAEGLSAGDPARAMLLLRVAAAYEEGDSWSQAGEAYEAASQIQSFPLRHRALADAARCYADAGDEDRAIQAFERLEAEGAELRIPAHIQQRLRELRAGREAR
jgi:tetratricopeptide (TPR) repeat protein